MRLVPVTLCIAAIAAAQSPLSLQEAVRRAVERYPAVQVSQEQAAAAATGIRLARTAYLPRVDTLAQLNRATRNNVYGMLLPQSTFPAISGPPLHANSPTTVWGTAIGFLVSWEPFDFGFRKSSVDAADAVRRRAETAIARTRLEVGTAAADAFLTILAAQRTVAAAEAAVARARVLHESVNALVKAELRPGADAARARAELALAETQQIQAEQAVEIARASLGQLLGVGRAEVAVSPGRLLGAAPVPAAAAAPDSHPAMVEQKAAIDEVQARQKTIDRSWFPRFNLQAASYARGTGAQPDFTTGGAASGLGPNIYNWGIGFSVALPVMDFAALRARKQGEVHRERAEAARLEQIRQDLRGRLERSQAAVEGARRVAQVAPVQLESARAAEQQAAARYKAGLGTIIEVAEAQRLLVQADIDDSLARLNVWRGLLGVAVAQGSLDDFLRD